MLHFYNIFFSSKYLQIFQQTSVINFLLHVRLFNLKAKNFRLHLKKKRLKAPYKLRWNHRHTIQQSPVWSKVATKHLPQRKKKLKIRNRNVRAFQKQFYRLRKAISRSYRFNFLKNWSQIEHTQKKPQITGVKRRIFLNTPLILNSLNKLLYKAASKKKKKFRGARSRIFVNLYKKVSWKMRTSRFAHWNLRTRGTLNERRYDKLLGAELQTGKTGLYTDIFYVTRFLLGPVTWKKTEKLIKTGLILMDGCRITTNQPIKGGTIFEFPYGPGLGRSKITASVHWRRNAAKARKFTYLLYKNKKRPEHIPRIFKKIAIQKNPLVGKAIVDPTVGAAAYLKPGYYRGQVNEKTLLKCTVLSLNNWRFRFD